MDIKRISRDKSQKQRREGRRDSSTVVESVVARESIDTGDGALLYVRSQ